MRSGPIGGAGDARRGMLAQRTERALRAAVNWEPTVPCPSGLLSSALTSAARRPGRRFTVRLASAVLIAAPLAAGIAVALWAPRTAVTESEGRAQVTDRVEQGRRADMPSDVRDQAQAAEDVRTRQPVEPQAATPRTVGRKVGRRPAAKATPAIPSAGPVRRWRHYTVRTYVAGVTTPFVMAATDDAGAPVLVPVALDRALQVGAVHANSEASGGLDIAPVRYATEEHHD